MGEFHMGSNSDCIVCTHPERHEFESSYFLGGMTSDGIADIVGCSESTVYHHIRHHLKPLIQKTAAPLVAIRTGEEMGSLRSNVERLNGELGVFLDDADRKDPAYVKNITALHREDRETKGLMLKLQEKTIGDVQQTIQADTVNILKVELAKESPEVWKRIRNKLLREGEVVEIDE